MTELESEVYRSIEAVDTGQWNNVVKQASLGSAFHRYEWLAAFEREFEFAPRHIVISKGGNPIGVMPNYRVSIADTPLSRLESTPLPGFGGPAVVGDRTTVLDRILAKASVLCRGRTLYHRIRTLDPATIRHDRAFDAAGYSKRPANCRFVQPLADGWEAIRAGMASSKRSNLRTARQQDYEIRECLLTSETLTAFHPTYCTAMERVGGEIYSREFFIELGDRFGDRVKMFAADVDGDTVGWHLYVVDAEQSSLHHLLSAVESKHFQYYPSELLHEHAMKWAINEGFKTYDFGETICDPDDGLFNYKREFGGDVVPSLVWRGWPSMAKRTAFHIGRRLYATVR